MIPFQLSQAAHTGQEDFVAPKKNHTKKALE